MFSLDPSNVTLIEAIWSFVSLGGLAATIWLLREALRDRRIMIEEGRNGPARLLANGIVRTETLRVVQLSVMSALGVIAMILPQAEADSGQDFRVLLGWLLTFVAVVVTGNAILDRKMRLAIEEEIIKIYQQGDDYRGVRLQTHD